MSDKKEKAKKNLKTFSIHETNLDVAHYFKKAILTHKHLENILNIIINKEVEKVFSLPKEQRDFKLYNLLLNPMIMKAVIANCFGKDKTKDNLSIMQNAC